MASEDRVVHLKQLDKVPSETACGKPLYTLGPLHSAVEGQDGDKVTCPDCKEQLAPNAN
jgi:hypothetical protein